MDREFVIKFMSYSFSASEVQALYELSDYELLKKLYNLGYIDGQGDK